MLVFGVKSEVNMLSIRNALLDGDAWRGLQVNLAKFSRSHTHWYRNSSKHLSSAEHDESIHNFQLVNHQSGSKDRHTREKVTCYVGAWLLVDQIYRGTCMESCRPLFLDK